MTFDAQNESATLDRDAVAPVFHQVVKVRDNGKPPEILNGGVYKGDGFDFKVVRAELMKPFDKGYTVRLWVLFREIPEGAKIKTADARWVTPSPRVAVEMVVPFEVER